VSDTERSSLFDGRDLLSEVRQFIHFSPWQHDVPAVPETPVAEWGTLAWARLAFALLLERAE
jgi:hypothetical protein